MFYRQAIAVTFLLAIFITVPALPQPGVTRERHIIHAPIKYKIIHHYKLQKVPVIVKKHFYYFNQPDEHEPTDDFAHSDDHHDFSGFHHQDDHNVHQDHHNEIPHAQHETHEDYEDHQQSHDTEYDDYDYE